MYDPPIIVPVHEKEVRMANSAACMRSGPSPFPTTTLTSIERHGIVLRCPYRRAHELMTMYAMVGRVYALKPTACTQIESITAEKVVATYTVRLWPDCWYEGCAERLGDLIASALVKERGGHNGIAILGDTPREEHRVNALWVEAPF